MADIGEDPREWELEPIETPVPAPVPVPEPEPVPS